MADLRNLPPELKPLGEQVPPEIRSEIPDWELRIRCDFARLLREWARDLDPEQAEDIRLQAKKVLEGLPIEDYMAELERLTGELLRLYSTLETLITENPQVPQPALAAAMPATAARMAELHQVALSILTPKNAPGAHG